MPSLVIRNLSPELHQKLKAAAATHRRSMTQQAIVYLEEAINQTGTHVPPTRPFKARIPLTDTILREAKRERR
ncbi:MAG: hypothetical protein JWO48_1516 [Bryobacterales bacterium]|nr:hypothetical protein [Bryobacterales bacterium]